MPRCWSVTLRGCLQMSVGLLSLMLAEPVLAVVEIDPVQTQWQPIQLDVSEPALRTSETADDPNPFLDYRLVVTFTGPAGESFQVPGFFAGDGQGRGEGGVWRVRFSADQPGVWAYRVSFRRGSEIAVDLSADAGTALPSDGEQGEFLVEAPAPDATGFARYGRLQYNGEHYLKFADGPYWIKGGVDSPENFFGFAGFDNTLDQRGGAGTTGLIDGVHHYATHVADWQNGDPEFTNEVTGIDGRGIIGAINYLSSEGVNSIYFLPMNLGGDGRETYPFTGSSGSAHDNTHYDVSKLFQWNQVLHHMQQRDIAAHIVLAEQEVPNTEWLDAGALGTQRKLYFRELVARFGYLLAIKWNLSEESRFGAERHREFAGYLRALDWAEHPIAVHTYKDVPEQTYTELLGDMHFDATSIQFSPENADRFVEEWRTRSHDAGWPMVIDMDEIGHARVGLTDQNIDELRKQVLYPVYFSGGNLEWYFGYHELPLGGDMRTEDFRTREPMYRYMRYARELLQNELPFWEMEPADQHHSAADAGVQVFEKPGEMYAVYLPDGSVGGELEVVPGTYRVRWFDPRTGNFAADEQLWSGERLVVTAPPSDADEDWVLLLQSPEAAAALPDETPVDGGDDGQSSGLTGAEGTATDGAMPGNAPALGGALPGVAGTGSQSLWSLMLLLLALTSRRRRPCSGRRL